MFFFFNWGRTEGENKERDIMIQGAVMGVARILALRIFSGESTRMIPAKTLTNSGEGVLTGLPL